MAERKQKVSIPLTVLSVLIAVIVVFPIVWMVLSLRASCSAIRCTCFPRTPRSSITPLCWRAASWVM